MSDDKKFTLDDILAEYDDKDRDPTSEDRSVPDVQNEPEYDDYEDGEEQDFSGADAGEPMFAPASLFSSETDDIYEEKDDIPDTEEEIFDDGSDDDTEINEELLVEEASGEETSDVNEKAAPDIDEEDISAGKWAERCPLCQGKLQSGKCVSCGYRMPDEDDISALYNYDPSDHPQPEEENIREMIPEIPEEDDPETEDIPTDGQEEAAAVSDENADAVGDVSDKWIIRFLKGIFPVKGDSVGEIIRKIIFLAALIVFIGAGIMLISTLIQSNEAMNIQETAQSVIMTTVATEIDEEGNIITIAPTEEEIAKHNFDVAEYYKKINEDYVGYLEVEGCDIYEPIVQGDDNDKYLRTNISGGYNKAGTVFMDYRCIVTKDYTSPNVVLYGHNQEDGTMFGNLKEYKQDPEFYSEHPAVKFSSEYETGTYLIYAYFVTHVYANQDSNGEVFHYHDYIETLNDESTFNWYINEVQERNQIVSPVDVQFGDKLLCLSTCSNEFTDSRFVVFARKLRDGESVDDYDFSEAYLNPYAKGVDWDAIMSGDDEDSQGTEIIDDDSAPEYTTWSKSDSKKNNGRGNMSEERRLIPPADETTVPEVTAEKTETKKKSSSKKTSSAAEETSVSVQETEETSSDESTVTEAPVPDEDTQTQTAV